jgi:hypothetical protein
MLAEAGFMTQHIPLMHLIRPVAQGSGTYCGKALGERFDTADPLTWYYKHGNQTLRVTDRSVKVTCEKCMSEASK